MRERMIFSTYFESELQYFFGSTLSEMLETADNWDKIIESGNENYIIKMGIITIKVKGDK